MRPRLVSSLPAHASIAVHRHGAHDCAPAVGPVVHDHCGLGVYLGGETRFWMRHEYVLGRGDLVLVPEGMPHMAREARDAAVVGLALCTSCMRGAWGDALRGSFADVRAGGVAAWRLTEEGLADVVRLIDGIEEELAGQRPARELMLDGLLSQLVAIMVRAESRIAATAASGWPRVVTDALAFIERNAARSISLADVSHAVARSPAHVAALMKEHTGRSVVEWITHGRMARARQLLLASDDGIGAIAEAVGYASASHFHRTFRREHDTTPGEWRGAHRPS